MINIQELIKKGMKPGFVAMNESGKWWWYEKEPFCSLKYGIWGRNKLGGNFMDIYECFDIAPYDDAWYNSLIEIKGEEKCRE